MTAAAQTTPSPVVLQGDRETPRQTGVLPVLVVLDRLRSAYNVGNIFRIAEAVRAEGIIACGYTAAPPHPKLEKTARGCDALVPCRVFETCLEAVRDVKGRGYAVYAVETVDGAPMYNEAALRFPCAFVLGNEALGVEQAVLDECDGCIALPALGQKNSINVGNAAAVVLFEALRQYRTTQ